MSRLRPSKELRTISTIDVTPLVDLTFLLLIVFMITAPVLENALDLEPPALDAPDIAPTAHRLVNLDRRGKLSVGNRATDRAGLENILRTAFAKNRELRIFIRADAARPYGEVMGLMRTVQGLGIANVSLVTSPES